MLIEADERETGLMHAEVPEAFKRIPNALNVAVLAVQFGCFALLVWLATWVDAGWMVAVCVGFVVCQMSIYCAVHEAEHGVLFSNRRANHLGGIALSALFPAPFDLLRQSHIGHHQRNRSDDEAFEFWFPGESPVWKWVQWIGILTGGFYLMIVLGNVLVIALPFLLNSRLVKFDRPSAAFFDSLNPKYAKLIALQAAGIIALHTSILWLTGIPAWRYLLMYACFGCVWSATQYVHHYGTERHITRGARNLWLAPGLDRILLNHNWHRTHHEHPTISWVHLDKLGRSTANERRGWLPWQYVKMWRGPRKATQRVENRFVGKVVR